LGKRFHPENEILRLICRGFSAPTDSLRMTARHKFFLHVIFPIRFPPFLTLPFRSSILPYKTCECSTGSPVDGLRGGLFSPSTR
jgi:hypothetical protein